MPEPVPPGFVPTEREQRSPKPRFVGEWMHCKGCGRKEKSSARRKSNWTFMEYDTHELYFCPECFAKGLYKDVLRSLMESE